MIAEIISHYRVLHKLGDGGMGVVYEAEDLTLGRHVALKFLPAELSNDRDAVERFRREARVASSLNHPHICTLYEIGEHQGRHFIAMEVMEGETLRTRIERGGLTVNEVADVGAQIADALEAAHAKGITHRDVKPANIFLTSRGEAKLLDFGLAKLHRAEQAAWGETETSTTDRLTTTGAAVGTMTYMSPEQALGKDVDARTDLFSLGIVLYEAATGTMPFRGDTAAALFDSILNKTPTAAVRLNPDVPERLEAIIEKALEKDRDLRYQSASDVRADLQRLRRDSKPSITPGASLAPVATVDAAAAPSAARGMVPAPSAGMPAATATSRTWLMAAIVAVAVAVIALGAWAWRTHLFRPAAAGRIDSIAVLPLDNYSRDPEQEFFADGMTEELTRTLANIGALKVISRTSAMQYKRVHKPIPQIARELNVDAVMEGSVVRAGDRVRITEQLIEGASDRHLWSQSYDRDLRDILSLQAEVAQAIAREIQVKLSPLEQKQIAATAVVNPAAHEAYLKGRFHLSKLTEPETRTAMRYFQQALAADPNYALAYEGLAECWGNLSTMYLPPREADPQARAAVVKALQLDDSLASAHAMAGMISLTYDWDWAAADRESTRAIQLSPSNADGHALRGWWLSSLGRWDEAKAEYLRAEQLDPLSASTLSNLEWGAFVAGHFDEAVDVGHKMVELDPDFGFGHAVMGLAYAAKHQFPEAISEALAATKVDDTPFNFAILANVYASAGRIADARTTLAKVKEMIKRRYVCSYEVAAAYVTLNDTAEAYGWLDKAYNDRSDCMIWLKVDPRYARIRSQSRFQDLMRRVGYPR